MQSSIGAIFKIPVLIYLTFKSFFTSYYQNSRELFRILLNQIYFTGVQSLPLASFLGILVGALVIMQSAQQLQRIGGTGILGDILVIVIIRELGPLLTSLIIIARSATAIAAEVATMRVNKEIEALEVMGLNPLNFVVFPRVVGGMIANVALGFYFIFLALLGGFLFSAFFLNIPFTFYLDSVIGAISIYDGLLFFIKVFIAGIVIFSIANFWGLNARNSYTEIPRVTTKTVVWAMIFTFSFNGFVSFLFYFVKQ